MGDFDFLQVSVKYKIRRKVVFSSWPCIVIHVNTVIGGLAVNKLASLGAMLVQNYDKLKTFISRDLRIKQILRNCYGDGQKDNEGREGLVWIKVEDGAHFLARCSRMRFWQGEPQLFIPPVKWRQDAFQWLASEGENQQLTVLSEKVPPFWTCYFPSWCLSCLALLGALHH